MNMDTTKIRAKLSESTVVKKTNQYYNKHKRFTPLISFMAGFSWDSFTLTRIDRFSDNLIIGLYILGLALLIVLIQYVDNEKITHKYLTKYREWYPTVMQFFFGGLFSAYVVFYFKSATLSKNWLFLLFLIALLIGNEFIKDHLENFKLNLVLFLLAVFAFFTFFIPVVLHTMNTLTFLFSGFLTLLFVAGIIYLLYRGEKEADFIKYKNVTILLASVFFFLNFLYFINWIPPVPLSLKEGGIYHHIHKADEQYELRFEKGRWYQFYKDSEDEFRYHSGDTVFCFASVFAPTKLDKNIFHHWQVYSEKKEEWVTTDRRSYRIVGGRDGGYRGYTYKKNLQEGKWRVDVETKEGTLLGRIPFKLINADADTSRSIFKTIYF